MQPFGRLSLDNPAIESVCLKGNTLGKHKVYLQIVSKIVCDAQWAG